MEEVKRRIKFPSGENGGNPDPLAGPLFEDLVDRHQEGSLADHVDPLTGEVYLAAYTPVKTCGWGVVVQHERKAALQPVTHLRSWMSGWGMIILVTMSLVMTGLWGGLIWTLREEERPNHG